MLNTPIKSWAGQRVWVIGASQGIGAAVAAQLSAAGAKLALSARHAAPLEALAGPSDLVFPLDITDQDAVLAAAGAIVAKWGQLDLVLIVAGTHVEMRAQSFDLAAARRLLDINLQGPLNALAAVLPIVLAQKRGGIAIVASVAGYRGLPKALVYGPSKAALINLAESLYIDLHPQGIGVYLVNPGFVDTPLTQHNDFKMPGLISAEEAARNTLGGIAAGKFEIDYPKRFTNWLKFARVLPYSLYFFLIARFIDR